MSDEQPTPQPDTNDANPMEGQSPPLAGEAPDDEVLDGKALDAEAPGDEASGDEASSGAPKRPRLGIPAWAIIILVIALTGVLIWAGDAYIRSRQQRHEQADLPAPTAPLAQAATAVPTTTPVPQATAPLPVPTTPLPSADTPSISETLILVADFRGASDPSGVDAAGSIYETLVTQADEHGIADIRIERLQRAVDESDVRSTGQEHQATYVLWGNHDGQDISVHLTRVETAQHHAKDDSRGLVLSEPAETDLCQPGDGSASDLSAVVDYVLAVAAYRQGEYSTADAYLDEVLALGEDIACPTALAHAHLYAGNLLALEGQNATALESYDTAIELAPDTPAAYTNRASIYYAQEDYATALEDLNQALVLDPQHANAYYYRANVNRATGKTETALADLDRALEFDPGHSRAYANRGLLHHNLGNYTAALDDYGQALALDPAAAEVYLNRGGTYATLGNFEAALDDYARTLELSPDDVDVYYNRGTVYAMIEAYDLALADLNRALELDPEFAQVYGNRGLVYKAMGQTQKAIADLERFLELSDNPQWRQMIEQHLADLKQE
jgi:tetratricopeptide (TPR) repeat protein